MKKKKIEYWSKHQELDKFNYRVNVDMKVNKTLFFASFFIPLMLVGISLIVNKNYISGIILVAFSSILFPIVSHIYNSKNKEEAEKAKQSFRIREAMLRVMYNDLLGKKKEKSITDELDEQFEEIKEKYKEKMENKDVENLAEKIMRKNEKRR